MNPYPISLNDVRAANQALQGVVVRTPVLENADVNKELGGRLLLKAENMQRTGAFKIRGAYHRLLWLSEEEKLRGAVSYSSGNHAIGLARACQMMGTSAVIVMPSDAPLTKQAAVRSMGAEVITYDRDTQISADVVQQIISESGRIEVPPSAHPQILAGAGTAALELLDDAAGPLDAVLIPCGGLTAATAVVMAEASPNTKVYAAEPELFDDTRRSLIEGKRVPNPKGRRTICDSIMTPIPGEMTFDINRRLLAGGVTASDKDARQAMRFAFEHFKTVIEPGAAVGLAAVLNGQIPIKDKTVGVMITGGNVDATRFTELVNMNA